MKNLPIGVFDSGVGGLSVLLEMQRVLPQETFIYLADQAFIPYGKKTEEELNDRVGKIMSFFIDKNVKVVVMACNTATVYTIDEMRQLFPIPIIGTVPVVKTIANITKTGKTAVLSTPATSKSVYLDDLIDQFAKGIYVEKVGGSNLEELVEKGKLNSDEIKDTLENVLHPLIAKNIDAIALGCTHYPFLKDQMQEIVGSKVFLVDSGGAVSRRLKEVLTLNNDISLQKGEDQYYTTGDAGKFEIVAQTLMKQKIGIVIHIDL